MEQYLIDTNIVSHYLSASMTKDAIDFMDDVVDAIPNISIISQIELLCWNTADKKQYNKVSDFVRDSNVRNISPEIVENCVKIRKGRKIKTPDAIIAATAITYGYILVTNNEKDFKHISNLKIVNPHLL